MQAAINNSNQEVANRTIGSEDRSPFGLQQQELAFAENMFLGFVAAMRHRSYKIECKRGPAPATAARDTTPLMVRAAINRSNQDVATCTIGSEDRSPFGLQQPELVFAENMFLGFVAAMRHHSYKIEYTRGSAPATAARDTTPPIMQAATNRSLQDVANPNRVLGAIAPSNRPPRIDDGAPFGSPTAGICFNTAERSWIRFVATMRHGSYESHHFSKNPQLRRPQIPQLRRPQKTIPQLAQFHTRSMAECGSPDLV